MAEKGFEDYDEEELEMLINGLIHPNDMFVSPDFMGSAFPPPVGGPGMGMPGMGGAPFSGSSYDNMLAQAYDDEDDDELLL